MALQDIVQQTVTGLGYELVELERTGAGLLRITIDLPWTPGQDEQFVNVEDCEKVTRQLQYALEVEAVDYKRLEVSSPGLDRPLRAERNFERFAGELVDLTLRAPVGAAGAGVVAAGRKKFRGQLQRAEQGGWQLVWSDEPPAKPGQRPARRKARPPLHALGFTLDEIKEARLAPVVDFKGRRPRQQTGES